MGCAQSSEGGQLNAFQCHKVYAFKSVGKSSGKIIISQTLPSPVHVYFQNDKSGLPQFIKGYFFQAKNQIQVPLDFLVAGNYKINLIFNWTSKPQVFQIKSTDQKIALSQIQIKQGQLHNYRYLGNICKQKGIDQKLPTVTTHLYHQPTANLILVRAQNFGQTTTYTIDLQQCKQKQNFDILNSLDVGQTLLSRHCRSCTLGSKSSFVWIIAPRVPYHSGNTKKWQINNVILGKSEMMQFGAGFDAKINPPPDGL